MKKILLCICGLTPQVVTETVYALAVQRSPIWKPDEIHVITTSSGKMLLEEKLLHSSQGRFFHLCAEYGLQRIRFDASTVYELQSENQYLEDIRSEHDNSIVADKILERVKGFCEDPNVQLHASLAGGRKTMSFYMGMAMQFYGRDHDQLSHVLIRPPFENHPDFFYPPKIPRQYTVFDQTTGKPFTVSSKNALIELAVIPFVKLRNRLVDQMPEGFSFQDHVHSVQKKLDWIQAKPKLEFNPKSSLVLINGHSAVLTPLEAALYSCFLERKRECQKDNPCEGCVECYLNPFDLPLEKICRYLDNCWGPFSERSEKIRERLTKMRDIKQWFLQNKSRLNKKIYSADPSGQATIQAVGAYGAKNYGISLDKSQIKIEKPSGT